MPTASAAPSTGSVPAPGSSSSTRLPGPDARAMAARVAGWPGHLGGAGAVERGPGRAREGGEVRGVSGERGQVALDRLLVADVGQHGREARQAAPLGDGK